MKQLPKLGVFYKGKNGIYRPQEKSSEFSYTNNSDSLFRKYHELVTEFANSKSGRDLLGIPNFKDKIWLLTPNGYHRQTYQNKHGYERYVEFYSRPIFSSLLTPALQYIDDILPWIKNFDEALRILHFETGSIQKVPEIVKSINLTVTTTNPDPNPESTSVDGNVAREGVNETFGTIRAGAGTTAYPSNALLHAYYLNSTTTSNQYEGLYRFIALFDTASIPDGDSISAGTFSLYGRSQTTALGNQACALVASTPASNTDLVAADYGQTGSTRFATDLSSWNTAAYNDWTLNASGLAAISKTGVSKFATRSANDLDNSAPTWASADSSNYGCYAADQADTTNDPKLATTHDTTTSTSTSTSTTTTSTSTTRSTSTTTTSTSTTRSTSTTTTSSSTSSSTTTTSSSTSTTRSTSTTTTSSSTSSSTTTTSTSSSTSTSTTTTSTSSSTSSSTSTTTTIDPSSGGLAFGEQNPTMGETAVSWQTFTNGSGVVPTVVGDANWGKLSLDLNAEGRSRVYDFGNSSSRTITVTENRYQVGQGDANLQIRGDDAVIFAQDDATPTWEDYSAPIAKTWRYIQVRAVGL